MKRLLKRIIVWAVRRAIQWYPDEAFTPRHMHLHFNPGWSPKNPKNKIVVPEGIERTLTPGEDQRENGKPKALQLPD
jgi:hypothetical protein